MIHNHQRGFTLLEVLIAMAIGLTILIFFGKSLLLLLYARDKNEVKQHTLQTAQYVINLYSQTGQTATKLDVLSGNTSLSVTGNPCRLFRYNAGTKSIDYGEVAGPACTPPANTTMTLNPPNVTVNSLNFTGTPQATDAKSVQMVFSLTSTLPFGTDTQSFTTTISLWGK